MCPEHGVKLHPNRIIIMKISFHVFLRRYYHCWHFVPRCHCQSVDSIFTVCLQICAKILLAMFVVTKSISTDIFLPLYFKSAQY